MRRGRWCAGEALSSDRAVVRRQCALIVAPSAVRGRLDGHQHAGTVVKVNHLALPRLMHSTCVEAEFGLHRTMHGGRLLGRDLRYFYDR